MQKLREEKINTLMKDGFLQADLKLEVYHEW